MGRLSAAAVELLADDASPAAAAERAGLTYASHEGPGISRRRFGRGFAYRSADGGRIEDPEILARIRALAIPPAWREVWICADPDGHIQATGRDARGRLQYIYHPKFREVRDEAKYRHVIGFALSLPKIRTQVAADMGQSADGRRQVLATVVHLLETTMIRVGNRSYAHTNHSFGLTTLEPRHVEISGTRLRFEFQGKSGKMWKLDIRDRRIVRILKTCQELPGQSLFRYVDEDGNPQAVSSEDVNAYLREISGADVTAKDFRTWTGTVMAAGRLAKEAPPETATAARRGLTEVVKTVAAQLGNTPAICRACYIHPAVVDAFLEGALQLGSHKAAAHEGLSDEEATVLAFLVARESGKGAVSAPKRAKRFKGEAL
ncbi:MAG TPA: DNA topoisomerase IB [Caulobacteraceae bacterium]